MAYGPGLEPPTPSNGASPLHRRKRLAWTVGQTGPVTSTDVAARPRVHYPCLEGLRALAALMVVVHHASSLAGPAHTPGWVRVPAEVMDSGVAIFFVLSGFLIYRPIAAAHQAGEAPAAWAGFLWRRLLRLVPAYWLALTFFWVAGSFDLGDDWWRYYFFLQIYSRTTALGGLVQAWSLCTEVTFYLAIPLWSILHRAVRRGRPVSFAQELVGCAALAFAAIVARGIISSRNPTWRGLSFQWLPTNLDLFSAGMVVAVVSVHAASSPALSKLLGRLARFAEPWWLAGAALFCWYAIRVGPAAGAQLADPNGAYTGVFWQQRQLVLALLGLLLLVPAAFGQQDVGVVRSVLRLRPIVWVGGVSYGLYLWHFAWMQRAVPRPGGFIGQEGGAGWFPADTAPTFLPVLAIGVGVGLVAAAVSWYLLEQPLQGLKGLVGGRPTR